MLEIFVFFSILGGGAYVAESHSKERRKIASEQRGRNAPRRKTRAAGRRYERDIASKWRNRYQQEHGKRVVAEHQIKSSQAARVTETGAHNQVRKMMAGLFIQIVKICNARTGRMPARLDRIRDHANVGRGLG